MSSDFDAFKNFLLTRKKDVVFLVSGLLLGVFLGWDIAEIFLFGVLIWAILGPISVRVLAFFALFFLAVVPIFILLGQEVRAEEFAIYTFYFMAIMAIRGIIEVRSEGHVKEKS